MTEPRLPSPIPTSPTPHAAPPCADPIQALRHATRLAHERLDQSLPLARDAADLRDYARHLAVLRDWQQALAPWLQRTGERLGGLALIEQDLADCAVLLGTSATSTEATVPQPIDLTALHRADDGSDAFCWGLAYVLEGSRLGGLVLYKRLHARLAPHPLRYLHARGGEGPSWPETLASLRQALAEQDACDAGCCGAVAGFEVLSQAFERVGCLP